MTFRPSMELERSAVRRTTPDERVAEPLSTPTRSGVRWPCSRPMARPSSATRAAISARETSTRPGRCAMGLLGRDEGGHRALGAHPVGYALGLGFALERAHANPEADLSVLARDLCDIGVEARLAELLLEAIGLRASLEGARLDGPEPRRLRRGLGRLRSGFGLRRRGLLDESLFVTR